MASTIKDIANKLRGRVRSTHVMGYATPLLANEKLGEIGGASGPADPGLADIRYCIDVIRSSFLYDADCARLRKAGRGSITRD